MAKTNNATLSKTTSSEILFDLRSIIGDYFVASVEDLDNELSLKFVNGQKFVISVKEV